MFGVSVVDDENILKLDHVDGCIALLLLLLSHFSHVRLCATP